MQWQCECPGWDSVLLAEQLDQVPHVSHLEMPLSWAFGPLRGLLRDPCHLTIYSLRLTRVVPRVRLGFIKQQAPEGVAHP